MSKQRLSVEEMIELTALVRVFSDLSKELEKLQSRLDEIEAEKTNLNDSVEDLKQRIEGVRNREKDFTGRLLTKYGPFKLDVETFEIEPT